MKTYIAVLSALLALAPLWAHAVWAQEMLDTKSLVVNSNGGINAVPAVTLTPVIKNVGQQLRPAEDLAATTTNDEEQKNTERAAEEK